MKKVSKIVKEFLQRWTIQHGFQMSVYLILLAFIAVFANWLQKIFLKSHFNTFNKNEISTEAYNFTSEFINSLPMDENVIQLYFILLVAIGALKLLQKSTEFNLFYKKTKIDNALEFATAFNSINISNPIDQIGYVKKHKIRVYQSSSPLLTGTAKEIIGKYYPFTRTLIKSNTYFFNAIGSKTLFLDEEEFNAVLVKESQSNLPIKEIIHYNNMLEENKNLIAENKKLKLDAKLALAREEKGIIVQTVSFLMGRIGAPLVERLKYNGHHNMYTDKMIQEELEKSLTSHSEIFEQIIKAKGGEKDSKKEPKDFITPTHITIVRKELGEFAKKSGRATKT